jgi:predicted ester cyclase
MNSKLDVVQNYFDAAWANPPSSVMEAIATTFSDDFQNVDEDGNVLMNKEAYLGMVQLLYGALNDLTWVLADLREEDDGVVMSGHFEGTHTGDLDLSAMGMGVIPASGKKIVWDDATAKWTVQGDKIVRLEPHGGASGLEGFLAPLLGTAAAD